MALKYEPSYEHISKIGDKEIKFKEWTAKEERQYLKLLEKQDDNVTDKMLYDILIKPCLEDKTLVLSGMEQKKLLIDIRIKSISEYLEDEHKCEKCGETSEIKVKLEDIMTFKKSSYKTIEVKDIKFNFGEIRSNKEKEKLSLKNGLVEYIYQDFLIHIHSIEMNGEVQDKFTKPELSDFIDSLPTKVFDEVFDEYQKMVDELDIEYKWTCDKCSHEETIDYTYIPNLLWA